MDKGGKVLISNRINNINGDSVWAWYRDNMQPLGWTAVNPPGTGSNYYTVTFTNGTSKAVLWFYGGEDHSAGKIEAGYRVELLYYGK